ncbi:alpha/beta hydrolase [Litchfieldia alkalitelluris]|uniref:alpha/beta hydrolase n=1 Tax=Litchfieldia alkalitelluris TaxID=304268 RepID=UPI000996CEB9|nr:alpha/beta hydrolase [Litchfieldia alkalitelluris]
MTYLEKEERKVHYAGIDIHYEIYEYRTNKPVVVLIHGFLSSTFSFRKLIPYLTEQYSVIALDFPPFGKSGKPKRFRYSFENIAKTIIGSLKSICNHKIIIIGHSMGGQLALHMARQDSSFIKCIILLCSTSYLKPAKKSLMITSYLPFFDYYVKYYLAKKGVLNNLLSVVNDHSLIDNEMIEGYSLPFENQGVFIGLTRMIRHREGDLSSTELKKIDTPCLLIWGEQDRIVPIHIGKRLHNDLPNSYFITYKDTGHLLPEEKPEDVSKDIIKFIEKQESNL